LIATGLINTVRHLFQLTTLRWFSIWSKTTQYPNSGKQSDSNQSPNNVVKLIIYHQKKKIPYLLSSGGSHSFLGHQTCSTHQSNRFLKPNNVKLRSISTTCNIKLLYHQHRERESTILEEQKTLKSFSSPSASERAAKGNVRFVDRLYI